MLNDIFKYLKNELKMEQNLSNLNKVIERCSFALILLGGLQEKRNVFVVENNFSKILHIQTRKFLETKNYWKNRAIRWGKLADENSKFFHIVATQSY
jgi:hypothetical protein